MRVFVCVTCFRDVAMAIVNSTKWKEALRNETLDLNTGNRDTPMRKLIRKMPGQCSHWGQVPCGQQS